MNLKAKLGSAISVCGARFGVRTPIAVRLQLTDRCDHRCLYCNIWDTKAADMPKEKVFSLLGQLKKSGTKRVSFSGGDPLLREDIGEIIDYCHGLGIVPEMNSRGANIDKKIGSLKNLQLLKVSIDGPEQVHDSLSGRKGAFSQSLNAIETAQRNGIKAAIATTITKHNIENLGFVLELARKYNILVAFQPLKNLYRGIEDMGKLYPGKDTYRRAIQELIDIKISGDGNMRNSLAGLKHIYH